jgi:hypothetical protein
MKRAVVAFMAAILCQGAFADLKTELTVVEFDSKSHVYRIEESGELSFEEKTLVIKENDKSEAKVLSLGNISKLLVKDVTAVNDLSSDSQSITLYPNPASSEIFISGFEGRQTVEIFSISGVRVMKTSVENGSVINISNLRQGVYIVKVDGKTVKLCKI